MHLEALSSDPISIRSEVQFGHTARSVQYVHKSVHRHASESGRGRIYRLTVHSSGLKHPGRSLPRPRPLCVHLMLA